MTFSLSWYAFLVHKRKLCNRNNFNAYPTHFVLIKLCWLWRISENASLSYKTTVSNSQKSLIKGIQDKNSVHYFLQLMSVGLAWKSVAKSDEKLVNQKYATLFLSWMPFIEKNSNADSKWLSLHYYEIVKNDFKTIHLKNWCRWIVLQTFLFIPWENILTKNVAPILYFRCMYVLLEKVWYF